MAKVALYFSISFALKGLNLKPFWGPRGVLEGSFGHEIMPVVTL